MKPQLDTPNSAMNPDEVAEINQNNIKKLQTTLQNTGAYVLKNLLLLNSSTQLAIATLASIDLFTANVSTNGGLVNIEFYSTFEVGAGVNIKFYLFVDNKQVSSMGSANGNAAAINVYGRLFQSAQMGEGRHTIQVKYTTNGAFHISTDSLDTRLLITETKL